MAIRNFNVVNFQEKISEAAASRVPKYRGYVYERGEELYF